MRNSLAPLSNIEPGETLTLNVFGDTEQFKVVSTDIVTDGRTEGKVNKVVTKDTQITIFSTND
jgi:sortase (surface protein transpeptidase)